LSVSVSVAYEGLGVLGRSQLLGTETNIGLEYREFIKEDVFVDT